MDGGQVIRVKNEIQTARRTVVCACESLRWMVWVREKEGEEEEEERAEKCEQTTEKENSKVCLARMRKNITWA